MTVAIQIALVLILVLIGAGVLRLMWEDRRKDEGPLAVLRRLYDDERIDRW